MNYFYQLFRLDDSVYDFSEEPIVLLIFDVEDEAAVLVLVLLTDVAIVEVVHPVLDFAAQLKNFNHYEIDFTNFIFKLYYLLVGTEHLL